MQPPQTARHQRLYVLARPAFRANIARIRRVSGPMKTALPTVYAELANRDNTNSHPGRCAYRSGRNRPEHAGYRLYYRLEFARREYLD